ncbi:hypothetical protein C8Q76DRAFT_200011 [Earliella scabrosa]|nr:hypothetical protein C8Q76DRAFT_200011 [Earliella scabrosa]
MPLSWLRVLDVDHIPVADIALLLLLLSPALLELYLSFHDDQPETDPRPPILPSVAGMLLESISSVAPDLTIFYMDEHFPAPSQHIRALGRLKKLKELKLCDPETTVDAAALRAISSLPSLKTLSIEDLRLYGAPLDLEESIRALETLYVHANPDDLVRFIRASQFAVLKHLDIMIHCEDGQLPEEQLSCIFELLPLSVHNLRIGFCDGSATSPPAGPLTDLLRLAQPLKNLVDLTIDSGARKITIYDDDLKVLADLWPRLHKFVFADDKEHPRLQADSRPTFAALSDLARRCPALETLAMPCLDATSLPPLDELPALTHGLHWLEFGRYIGDATAADVAEAVHRLFPALEFDYNTTIVPPAQEGVKPWHPVWDHLKTIHAREEKHDPPIADKVDTVCSEMATVDIATAASPITDASPSPS